MGGGFTTCVADGVGASYFMFDDAILLHANARTSMHAQVFTGRYCVLWFGPAVNLKSTWHQPV
jgi:hypothetical protein